MIYVDVSAAVHSRAGLGRYSERLADALYQAYPGRVALFYNQGSEGQLPSLLQAMPRRSVRLGYKPWRSAVLLGQLFSLGFNRIVPDALRIRLVQRIRQPLTIAS